MLALIKEIARPFYHGSKYAIFKLKHPSLSLHFSARLGNDICIGNNVSVGEATFVDESTLGNNVEIRDNCFIHKSSLIDSIVQGFCTLSNTNLDSFTNVYSRCYLSNVSLGKFSYVASDSQLSCTQIGNFCSLGPQILCGYGEHPTNFTSTHPAFFSVLKQCGTTFAEKNHFVERRNIIVGHDVWIGARAFIRDGVKIGHGAIIAAGAVVVKDVPDYAIVGDVPAELIRFRFSQEVIQQLLTIQWWNWSVERLRLAQPFFVKEDIHPFIEFANKY